MENFMDKLSNIDLQLFEEISYLENQIQQIFEIYKFTRKLSEDYSFKHDKKTIMYIRYALENMIIIELCKIIEDSKGNSKNVSFPEIYKMISTSKIYTSDKKKEIERYLDEIKSNTLIKVMKKERNKFFAHNDRPTIFSRELPKTNYDSIRKIIDMYKKFIEMVQKYDL